MSTSNRVRRERQRREWSQTRLSALTGIAGSDISAIENGKRYVPPGWRRRLAVALRVSELELFPDDTSGPA
jgi:transcriptional regulator with XRE-family HTH domain